MDIKKLTKTHRLYHSLYHRTSTRYNQSNRQFLMELEARWKKPQPHYTPRGFPDKISLKIIAFLRWSTDYYFKEDLVRRAVMLETVAAVPGIVAGMNLHLRSLRRLEPVQWIKIVMDEAENERMHLMALLEMYHPNWHQRLIIMLTQGVWFACYWTLYTISPRMGHRFTGYLEEEAVKTYTHFLELIDAGKIKNIPATRIAKEYWGLPDDATLRDAILAIRSDETDHRLVNHFLSDICGNIDSDYFKDLSIHNEGHDKMIEELKIYRKGLKALQSGNPIENPPKEPKDEETAH